MYQKGFLPEAGGMMDQPLHLMNIIHAIEDVCNLMEYKHSPTYDMSKLTAEQAALVRWIDG